MVKKILVRTVIALLMAGFIVLLWLSLRHASKERSRLVCSKPQISIEHKGVVYLQERDINRWLNQNGVLLKGQRMDEIPAAYVESVLSQNLFVARADVYTIRDSVLRIEIRQRDPHLKVVGPEGKMFQIDAGGVVMPVNPDYRARLRVASGYIPFGPEYGLNVNTLPDNDRRALLKTIFLLNARLEQDELWDALFEQIYVNRAGEIELLPKVGGQIVLLGRVRNKEDLDDKLDRLRLFYQKAMKGENWQKYSKLNLKYKNQLVATRCK